MRLTKKAMAALLRLDGAVARVLDGAPTRSVAQHYVLVDGVVYYDRGANTGSVVHSDGTTWLSLVENDPRFKPIPLIKVRTQLLRAAYHRKGST